MTTLAHRLAKLSAFQQDQVPLSALPLPAEIDRLRAERDALLVALLAIEPMLAGDSPLHVRYSREIDQVRHAIARATPIDQVRP